MIETCILNYQGSEQERDLLSCSLFLRFQECMDMIRENIDYIDRYRIVQYEISGNLHFNEELLQQLKEYHDLYGIAINKLYTMNHIHDRDKIDQFRSNWEAPRNNINISEMTGKTRIIQNYFAKKGENSEQAINTLKAKPFLRIYDALSES